MSDELNDDVGQDNETTEGDKEKRSLKAELRENAAKALGVAVELTSILGGESGSLVDAEREMVEAGTEEFIDKIDGEG